MNEYGDGIAYFGSDEDASYDVDNDGDAKRSAGFHFFIAMLRLHNLSWTCTLEARCS